MGRSDEDFENTTVWASVLSLTGALLSHMAANPQTKTLVDDMLRAGSRPSDDPERFHEPLHGLHTREISNPEVLRHFFGV